MITLTIPFYDHDGKLSPILNEALERGAKCEHNPNDPSQETMLCTLKKDDPAVEALKAFDPAHKKSVKANVEKKAD